MGVTNLWALLEPCGRRIDVQALRGKRVAVDASGRIFKFIKAMRDDQGELLPNAHLIGFFRRICKPLFYNIRPIFIFDGSTPALKRQTVIERRRRREQQEARVKKTAEKLLLNRLKQHALSQAAAVAQEAGSSGPSNANDQTQLPPPSQLTSEQPADEAGPSTAANATAAGRPEGTTNATTEMIASDDSSSSDSEPDFEPLLPEGDGPVDPVVLSTLPPSMQLEIMLRLRDRQMAANRGGFEERTGKPEAFSEYQINQYLKTSNLRRQLDTLRGTGSGANGVARPVAAEEAREYVLEKDGDLEELEKGQRRAVAEEIEGGNGDRGAAAAVPVVPVAEGLKLSFEINKEEIMSDDSLEWEDVEDDAGAMAQLGSGGSGGGSGGKEGEHWRERAARRQKYWSLSHGFQMGRKLAQWGEGDEEGGDGGGVGGRSPVLGKVAGIVEEDEDVQLQEAIRRSLMHAEENEMQMEAVAAEITVAKQVEAAAADKQQVEEVVLVDDGEEMWEDVIAEPTEPAAAVAIEGSRVQEKDSAQAAEVDVVLEKEVQNITAVSKEAPPKEFSPLPPQPSPQQPSADIVAKEVVGQTKFQQKKIAKIALSPVSGDTAASVAVESAFLQQVDKQSPLKSSTMVTVVEEVTAQPLQAQEMETDDVDVALIISAAEKVVEGAEKSSLSPPATAAEPMEEEPAATAPTVEGDNAEAFMDDDALNEFLDNLAGTAHDKYQPEPQEKQHTQAAVPAAPSPLPAPAPAPALAPQKEPETVLFAPEVDEFERLVAEAEHFEDEEEPYFSPPQPSPTTSPSSAAAAPPESSSQAQRQKFEDILTASWTNREGLPSFDPERLQREEAGLRAEHRAAAGQSDTPTDVMYAECQQLLQLFGLPYLIAPSEAEAQAAWLDAAGLVDGVVTDDNDAFLFGAQHLYRNIFENAKYVEEYRASDVESELGLNRQRLVLMALLLGSDYTSGISGVGVVNAVEIVHAFQGVDGLERFAKWMAGVDEEILKLAKKAGGAGGDDASNQDTDKEDVTEEVEGERAELEKQFQKKHKNVQKSWNLPKGFPSREVVDAYLEPKIDCSKEKFTFARPDLDLLRRFCLERFGWEHSRTDELLLPVLKAYDARQTQQTLDTFVAYRQRFAKIRSKRLRQAVAGITGASNDEIAFGDEEGEKRQKKAAAGAGAKGKGKKKGRGGGKEVEEIFIDSSSNEDEDEIVIVEESSTRIRGRGTGAGGRVRRRLPRRSKQSQQKQPHAGQNNE